MTEALKKLFILLALQRKDVISIYFFSIFSSIIQLTVPLGIQSIVGLAMGATMVTSIYVLVFIIVLGVLVAGIMRIKQMQLVEKIQQHIFVKYAFEFTETIPNLDLGHIDKYYLPEKVNRFFDITTLQKSVSKLLLDIPSATIQLVVGFTLLALYHPFFIIMSLIVLLILFVILKVTSGKGFKTSIQESNNKYEIAAWIQEMARIAKSFKLSHGSHINLIKADNIVTKYLNERTQHFKILRLQYTTLVIVKVILTFMMLAIGVYLLVEQKLNIGEFIAAEIIILMSISATEKIIKNIDIVYDVTTSLEKINSVLEIEVEKKGGSVISDLNGININLRDLSYTYSNGNKVLDSINLNIKAGDKICLQGVENSGKSTLLKLLSGNYQNFEGNLYYNGIQLQSLDLKSLRTSMGVYLNENDIFKGTVFQNISMARVNVTENSIIELIDKLGFDNFFDSFPEGFQTELNSNGNSLSSTSVKRILLLRALCTQPKLVLLEEPCLGQSDSAVSKIENYLLNDLKDSTVVVISSSNRFAASCNVIVNLEKGKIVL